MTTAAAPGAAAPVDEAARAAILDAARKPVASALGKPVLFRVTHLAASGRWAFLRADMQGPGGQPIDYAGTRFADDAANGVKSHSYAALLHRDAAGHWQVADQAIGPTDVAWASWAKRHGAPAAIFG